MAIDCYDVFACELESAPACNFNCVIETESVLKVTGSHVHSKRGSISNTVQGIDIVITDH